MRALAPVRLQPLDKAARGYGLITGLPPAWRKARAVQLRGDHDGRGRAADHPGCLRAPLDGERGRHPRCARSGRPAPDSRGTAPAALGAGLVQDGPGRPGASRLECGAALASRSVGPGTRPRRVRDRDDRARCERRGAGDPALAVLAEIVDDARWKAHHQVRDTLASERYGDIAFGLACWVACRGWRQGADIDVLLAQRRNVRDFAAEILTRRHRQVRKRGRNFAGLGPASPATSCGSSSRSSATAPSSSPRCSRVASSTATVPRPRGCRICSAT